MKSGGTKRKIVVIGGTGLIGSKAVALLNADGFEAAAASPDTGVNTITGDGLAEVLEGASVVVDVSNSPSFEDDAVMNFFTTSTGNLLRLGAEAGVKHHVVLSVVGADRLPEVGYYRAKAAQEDLVKNSPIPFSIVHATQFFEFAKGLADSATEGDMVRLPPILIQPMAADDVAKAVAEAAEGEPANGTLEIGGPEILSLPDFVRLGLESRHDLRKILVDENALFFGGKLSEKALLPGKAARLSSLRFVDWLAGKSISGSDVNRVKAASE